MNKRKKLAGVVVCVAQVSLLVAGLPQPSFATISAADDSFSSQQLTRVDDFEKTLFGSVRGK
ncbi:MAG: hypothetical protein K2Z81_08825, partial [Cyanobacteria bacterium]|nr:hypothetical protein [Cyanobacteriota bacterium]